MKLFPQRCSYFFNPFGFRGVAAVATTSLVTGMIYYDRVQKNYWNSLFQRSLPEKLLKLHGQTCVVTCISTEDDNQALDLGMSNIDFKKLDRMGVIPVVRKIDHPHQVRSLLSQLKNQKNEVPIVILVGHGHSDGIEMGKGVLHAWRLGLAPISKNSEIVLYSCSTANERTQLISVARKISLLNPGVSVFAAQEDVMANTLQSYISFHGDSPKTLSSEVSLRNFWGKQLVVKFQNGMILRS